MRKNPAARRASNSGRGIRRSCSATSRHRSSNGASVCTCIWHCLAEKLYFGKDWILIADNREEWHLNVLERDHDVFGRLSATAPSWNRRKRVQIGISVSKVMRIMCTTLRISGVCDMAYAEAAAGRQSASRTPAFSERTMPGAPPTAEGDIHTKPFDVWPAWDRVKREVGSRVVGVDVHLR